MKILLAPDKFRGSLSADEVIDAMQKGICHNGIEVFSRAMADGGEHTAVILTKNTGGYLKKIKVHNPLKRLITAQYGISGDDKTAFIEMAEASGLHLLTVAERNPLKTSTFGTGELILDAIKTGVQEIVLCIGGSATNDAGIGMAAALGFRFLDKNGMTLEPIGENLIQIDQIVRDQEHPQLQNIKFSVACDVQNPFYGPNGAAQVYAAQKGADQEATSLLDDGLKNLAGVISKEFHLDLQAFAGAGAAGGLGGGCLVFLNAKLQSGIAVVLEALKLEEVIKNVDLIITGEGKLDKQSAEGKVIKGLADLAQRHHKPIIAFCGTLELNPHEVRACGLSAAFSIINAPMALAEAQANAATLLSNAVANVLSVYKF